MNASDLHLTTNTPPQVRVHGRLQRLPMPDLTPPETKQLAYSVMTDAQKKHFEETLELDFSFGIRGLARFRCNVFNQRGAVAAVYRLIPEQIRGFPELGLPPVIARLAERPRGLVLITGPTGSGKSTTLAAMIDKINNERHDHILTIEDPIEYIHLHKKCLVNQREVHSDTTGFGIALRAALREDPDIVLIGEMRDLETVEAALRIAETGHLTLATLHTNSASQTINRIIDVFPAHQQAQIRTQLSLVLEGIVCQARDPEPDPRGQDPPDLLGHAVRPGEAGDADVQPVAGDALPGGTHLDGDGAGRLVAQRGTDGHGLARRRCGCRRGHAAAGCSGRAERRHARVSPELTRAGWGVWPQAAAGDAGVIGSKGRRRTGSAQE
jgi:twitching motility protein PilT